MSYLKRSDIASQIADAFLQLMCEKPYEEITVTDIVSRADVARASFYRNFESINDVLDYAVFAVIDDFMPDSVLPHSNKVAYWKCSICSHEWKTKINGRTNGRGCPACASKQRVISFRENNYLRRGKNDLATEHPDLCEEWNTVKNSNSRPSDFTSHSKEKVWWICKTCGNEWQATISNRVTRNSGCPRCSKHQRTSFPEQALLYYIRKSYPEADNSYTEIFEDTTELDIYIHSLKTGIEYDGKAWHSNSRAIRKANEKYEACKKYGICLIRVSEISDDEKLPCDYFVLRTDNTVHALDECILKTLDLLKIEDASVDSEADRAEIMKQYIEHIGEKSIENCYPEEARLWDTEKNGGILPRMVNANSNVSYWWKCELGHSYKASPSNKLRNHDGCPICSGHEILSGFNDLKTKHPDIAEDWDYAKNAPLTPDTIMPGSVKKIWWKCKLDHSYQATPNSRTSNRTGCPYCSNHAILEGYNDLTTLRPDVAEFFDEGNNSVSLHDIGVGSMQKINWKCKSGHSWQRTVNAQVKSNLCPYCSGKRNTAPSPEE